MENRESRSFLDFELLAQCYRSDLARLDAIKEAAWYFSQLNSSIEESVDFQNLMDGCDVEKKKIAANLIDLESLLNER